MPVPNFCWKKKKISQKEFEALFETDHVVFIKAFARNFVDTKDLTVNDGKTKPCTKKKLSFVQDFLYCASCEKNTDVKLHKNELQFL